MSRRLHTLLAVVAVGGMMTAGPALSPVTATAFADPPHGCPPGLARQGRCDEHRSRHRDRDDRYEDRRDEAEAYRAGYEDGQRDAWRAGDRLHGNYNVIRSYEYDRYGLQPPPNGFYYAKVDDDVLLVSAATQIISELID
jgi:Ni/Co efflux regulator RcnB